MQKECLPLILRNQKGKKAEQKGLQFLNGIYKER